MTRTRSNPQRSGVFARVLKALALVGKVLAVAVGLLFVAFFASLAVWPPINDVTTGETPEYPDVQPRAYSFSQPRVVAAALESIASLERLALVSEVASEEGVHVIEATATTRSGRFTDDVSIRVDANGDGGAVVFIRSHSRVGRGDFGQNARTIRSLQRAMDENLGLELSR